MKIFAKEYYERRRVEKCWDAFEAIILPIIEQDDFSEYSPGWSEVEWIYTDGDDVVGD